VILLAVMVWWNNRLPTPRYPDADEFPDAKALDAARREYEQSKHRHEAAEKVGGALGAISSGLFAICLSGWIRGQGAQHVGPHTFEDSRFASMGIFVFGYGVLAVPVGLVKLVIDSATYLTT
jgi:hypothetical protein